MIFGDVGQHLVMEQTVLGGPVADAMVTGPKTHRADSTQADIRALFRDDHVHMALVVAPDGRLVTTIERSDLAAAQARSTPVTDLGTLAGRTVGPSHSVAAATSALLREGRRRLAVVDPAGRLLGLLCLKRDGTGYCSEDGVRARASQLQRR
ncbi:MAG: hypothetical protein QOJ78_10 [Pseudonocardiales bacterium]|nr:hypothetical protein [Pseudonocardiales bacterium]